MRIFNEVEEFEQFGGGLHPRLHRIATIDKEGCPLGHDDGNAGRAVETGDPVKPLGIGGDVLAEVLIIVGDDKGVQLLHGQLGPDLGDAGFNYLEIIHVVSARWLLYECSVFMAAGQDPLDRLTRRFDMLPEQHHRLVLAQGRGTVPAIGRVHAPPCPRRRWQTAARSGHSGHSSD